MHSEVVRVVTHRRWVEDEKDVKHPPPIPLTDPVGVISAYLLEAKPGSKTRIDLGDGEIFNGIRFSYAAQWAYDNGVEITTTSGPVLVMDRFGRSTVMDLRANGILSLQPRLTIESGISTHTLIKTNSEIRIIHEPIRGISTDRRIYDQTDEVKHGINKKQVNYDYHT